MTRHFSPQELIDTLEGAPPRDRADHLAGCARCRARHDELSEMVAAARTADAVPDPPAFFWERLTSDVRRATAALAVPRATGWSWRVVWRPVTGAVFAAAATTLVVWLHVPVPMATMDRGPVASSVAASDDDVQLNALMEAAALSPDDAYQIAAASPTLDRAVLLDDLTPTERATFVQLLQSEMGGTE